MSVWSREEEAFENLPLERRAKIEIVSSAYASVFAEKAYLTMPITTGPRYYDVLDRYGVKTPAELERKRPGALREEIIIPNIEDGKALAARIKNSYDVDALIVPGIFEGRAEQWTQEEYMVLWLRLIGGPVKHLFLSDGWEYSNGGAIECCYGLARELGQAGDIESTLREWSKGVHTVLGISDSEGGMEIIRAAARLKEAIQNLRKRGYDTAVLLRELAGLVALAWTGASFAHTTYHFERVVESAVDVGADKLLEWVSFREDIDVGCFRLRK